MSIERPIVHYVLSTHWDREWYESFQHYRWRLVHLLDRVLAGFERGELDGPFTCDGQAIILDDYLEIRPERRAVVDRLVREARLIVGPWYVLPDEWLVSGEAMVRNLELGRRIARGFGGKPSNAGFVCDLFGHVSQLPQILAGFGVTGALVWRGIELDRSSCAFTWRGADGTELPAYRFGKDGYCDFAVRVRKITKDERATIGELGDCVADELARSGLGVALLFDGADHIEWDPDISALLREYNALPDRVAEVRHDTLDAFLDDLQARRGQLKQVVVGELRRPGSRPQAEDGSWLIPGVLSSRVWIKQQNDRCTALLTQQAEPFALLAGALLGVEYPHGFLEQAWKFLLQNHPHDSICGCSIDDVHRDVEFRFRQSRQIAERVTRDLCGRVARSIAPALSPKRLRVVAFNPRGTAFDGVAVLTLDIPSDYPKFNEFFGFEPKPAFVLRDADGNPVPYQRLGQQMNRTAFRTFARRFPQSYKVDRVTVALPLKVPAFGYAALSVEPGEQGVPTRSPMTPTLATSERSMSNGVLSVEVGPAGQVTITDRRSGNVFERLLTIEDTADIGDGWYHGLAVNDRRIVSSASSAEIEWIHDTPLLCTLRVRLTLDVPGSFDFATMRRSERRVPLVVESELTLRQGADWLDVTTRVVNNVKDHRVRVLLPSGAGASHWLADSAFDVVERPIALDPMNHTFRELQVETAAMHSFAAVHDDTRGLAVVATGLKEVAVRDLPDRPIALTLYRSTGRTVNTDGEPEGQLFGHELEFRWRIVPLRGRPDVVALSRHGQQLAADELRLEQVTAEDIDPADRLQPTLPAVGSLLSVEGDVVVTSLRQTSDGATELRAVNPTTTSGTLRIVPGVLRPKLATPCDFEGNPVGAALSASKEVVIALEVPAKKIVTLRLR